MDNEKTILMVREHFEKRLSSSAHLKGLIQKLESETATLADTDTYACQVAECYNMALREVLGKASIEEYREAIDAVIPKGFNRITDRVNDYVTRIINQQLQAAGIGMAAVPADYDRQKEQDAISGIRQAAESVDEVAQAQSAASLQIEAFSQKAVMNTILKNAGAQHDAGLDVRVTRIYDGVGVHMRKDRCEWCLSRCGEDMPYSEAYAKGAFERHPGCHCEILYKPRKGGWQRQTNWKSNTWEEAGDQQALKMRRRYGL